MCGIFGIVSQEKLTDLELTQFQELRKDLSHRGPDGDGEIHLENIAIGMTRLAIVDEKQSGQPIWNKDRNICVFANCEIYNFKELRSEFKKDSYKFATNGDVETILQAYIKYGEDFAKHLYGMFAIVIVDLKAKKIIFTRDRLGEKSLYINLDEARLVFSSELIPLLTSGIVKPKLNSNSVSQYLEYGYFNEDQCLISNVRKIKPGTVEIYSFLGIRLSTYNFWSLSEFNREETRLEELIQTVVSQSSMSDKEIVLALSSGIDSSLLALLLKNDQSIKFQTLTAKFSEGTVYDESKIAAEFAKKNGIENRIVKVDSKKMAGKFRNMVVSLDEPLADIASFGYLNLIEETKTLGKKVLMFGQGVDELFWGYEWVRNAAKIAERRKNTILETFNLVSYIKFTPIPTGFGPKLDWLSDVAGLKSNISQLIKDLLDRRSGNLDFYLNDYAPRSASRKKNTRKILGQDKLSKMRRKIDLQSESSVSKEIISELASTYLRLNGLQQLDRLGMSQSVEIRCPYVDHRIVEFALSNSEGTNHFGNNHKDIFKNEVFMDNAAFFKKKGFKPPIKEWYRLLHDEFRNELANMRLVELGVVKKNTIKYMKRPLTILGRSRILWLELLILEMWIRQLDEKLQFKNRKIEL